MGFLVCEKCGGYYKLQEDESPESFDYCKCGGELIYYKHIHDYLGEEDRTGYSKEHKNDIHFKREQLNEELEKYQNVRSLSSLQFDKSTTKLEKLLLYSCSIMFIFSIIPLFYSIFTKFWPLMLISVIGIISAALLYLNLKNSDKISQVLFMYNIYIIYAVYFILIPLVYVISLIMNKTILNSGITFFEVLIIFFSFFAINVFILDNNAPYRVLDPKSRIMAEFYESPGYNSPLHGSFNPSDWFESEKLNLIIFLVTIGVMWVWLFILTP